MSVVHVDIIAQRWARRQVTRRMSPARRRPAAEMAQGMWGVIDETQPSRRVGHVERSDGEGRPIQVQVRLTIQPLRCSAETQVHRSLSHGQRNAQSCPSLDSAFCRAVGKEAAILARRRRCERRGARCVLPAALLKPKEDIARGCVPPHVPLPGEWQPARCVLPETLVKPEKTLSQRVSPTSHTPCARALGGLVWGLARSSEGAKERAPLSQCRCPKH